MNINVNGINVEVKQAADGSWYASYTTEFAPPDDIHNSIADAAGAETWQHQCIAATAPWGMNAGGDATWVMDFGFDPPYVVRSAMILLRCGGFPVETMTGIEVLAAMSKCGYVWTNAGWVHNSALDIFISLAHGS